jgi:hypothetical protein
VSLSSFLGDVVVAVVIIDVSSFAIVFCLLIALSFLTSSNNNSFLLLIAQHLLCPYLILFVRQCLLSLALEAATYAQSKGARSDVARVFSLYEQTLRDRNQIDFDDMLWLVSNFDE